MEDTKLESLFDQVPSQLKDDLLYCRRALCDFSKVHSTLTSRLNNTLDENGAFKLAIFLETLENEKRVIEKELNSLMDELKVSLRQRFEQQDAETMDAHVTSLLNKHGDRSSNRVIKPQQVTVRCSAAELLQNFEIFSELVPSTIRCDSSTSSKPNINSDEIIVLDDDEIIVLDDDEIIVLDDDLPVTHKDGYENHPVATHAPVVITISSPEASPELSDDKLKQIEFLKYFNLVTHEETNSLKRRRSKRMRVPKERKDFVSGKQKRVSTGTTEKASNDKGQKRPRGGRRSVGVPKSEAKV